MIVKELIIKLQQYCEDLEITLESHCGQLNDCVGVLEKSNGLILCNEEGYAQEEPEFNP